MAGEIPVAGSSRFFVWAPLGSREDDRYFQIVEKGAPEKLKNHPIMKLVDMYYWCIGLRMTANATENGSKRKRINEVLSETCA